MSVRKILTRNIVRLGASPECITISPNLSRTFVSLSRPPAFVSPLSNISSSLSSPSSSFSSPSSFHTSSLDLLPRDRKDGRGMGEKKDPTIREVPVKQKYLPVDLETSMEYLKSEAYAQTYEGLPFWHETLYRRNFKGPYNPIRTRSDCVISGRLVGNPCPICRDSHLVVHHENLDLLKQFIEPQTGAILSHRKTNICQKQHKRVEVAIGRARDRGLMEMRVPHRDYDYADYYSKDLLEECDYEDILSPAEHSFMSKTKDVAERQLGRNDVIIQDAFQVEEDDDFSDDSDSDSERHKAF